MDFFAPKELLFYPPGALFYFKELMGAYSIYLDISSYYLQLN